MPGKLWRRIVLYVEEADDDANKVSQRPGARPARERIVKEVLTLPVITTCKVVTYNRMVYLFLNKVGLLRPLNILLPGR